MSTSQSSASRPWQIDTAHSSVDFSARHMMISTVRGRLGAVTGNAGGVDQDGTPPVVEVSIDAAGIDTGNAQRDAHLRSADFLDVENYPAITFTGDRIEGSLAGEFTLRGDLTIHGVTREVALAVENHGITNDPWGNRRAGFSATGRLSRGDFGLTWNQAIEAGGVMVSDEIKFSIDVALIQPKE